MLETKQKTIEESSQFLKEILDFLKEDLELFEKRISKIRILGQANKKNSNDLYKKLEFAYLLNKEIYLIKWVTTL